MKKEVMNQKSVKVETVTPSACLISSEDIANAIGLSHGEVCNDIEVMVVEDLPRSGVVIVTAKEGIGGVGMDPIYLLDLEAVMEWTNNMKDDEGNDIRQAILSRFLELNSEGTKHYENLHRKKLSTVAKSCRCLQRIESRLFKIRDTAKALKKAIIKNNSRLVTSRNPPQVHVGWRY